MTASDHPDHAAELDAALHESCEYATLLWHQLEATRRYLYESLPSDPRAPGIEPHACASPTGPDDEAGWARWTETYAAATSVLAGAHGDSGFGLGEAKKAARERREAPNLKVLAGDATATPVPPAAAAKPAAAPPAQKTPTGQQGLIRRLGLAALVLLALRGLRR